MKAIALGLLGMLSMVACGAGPTTAPSESRAETVAGEFEPFGVSVKAPESWVRLPEGQTNTVARWGVLKSGSTTDYAVIVGIEIAPGQGRTAEMAGNDLAKLIKGTTDPKAQLAGETACRVTADLGDGAHSRPVEALVARHKGYIYTLSAAATGPGVAQSDALQELRRGFRFVELGQPVDHLDLRAEPVTILKTFTIRPIVTLRPSPKQRRGAVQMRVYNYRRSRADLVLGMEVVTFRRGATLQAVGEAIAAQNGVDSKTIEWSSVGDAPRRLISKPFTLGQYKMPLEIGLVQLSDTQAALLTFGLSSAEEADRLLYEAACMQMVQSVAAPAR